MAKAKDTNLSTDNEGTAAVAVVTDDAVEGEVQNAKLTLEEFIALQRDDSRRAEYTKFVYEVGYYDDEGKFVPAKYMMTMIPDEGMILPEGTTHRFTVNGAIWDLPIGEMVEVPVEIGRMVQERFRTKGKNVFLLDPRVHAKGSAISEIM